VRRRLVLADHTVTLAVAITITDAESGSSTRAFTCSQSGAQRKRSDAVVRRTLEDAWNWRLCGRH
jgi:hypothetical protein